MRVSSYKAIELNKATTEHYIKQILKVVQMIIISEKSGAGFSGVILTCRFFPSYSILHSVLYPFRFLIYFLSYWIP